MKTTNEVCASLWCQFSKLVDGLKVKNTESDLLDEELGKEGEDKVVPLVLVYSKTLKIIMQMAHE